MTRGLWVAVLTLAAAPAGADISGRVLSPAGQPLANAAVQAYVPEMPDERTDRYVTGRARALVAAVRSGTDGTFRFPGAHALLEVEVRADGHAPARAMALADQPATIVTRQAVPKRGMISAKGQPVAGALVVWTGESGEWIARTGSDGTYAVPDPAVWAGQLLVWHPDFAPLRYQRDAIDTRVELDHQLEAGVVIEGKVVDGRTGRPLPGATLLIAGPQNWPLGKAGPGGAFRLTHAPADWTGLFARSGTLVGAAQDRTGRLTIRAGPGRTLSGTVRAAAAGSPLAGASVLIRAGAGTPGAGAFTNTEGRYRIEGLLPGAYGVAVEHLRYRRREVASGEANAVDVRTETAVVRDYTLEPIAYLTGRVENEEHQGIANALVSVGLHGAPSVYAHPASSEGGTLWSNRLVAYSAPDGSFHLPLPAREAEVQTVEDPLEGLALVALAQGYAAGRAPIPRTPQERSRPIVVVLSRGVELKGRVVRPDGAPVAGAGIALAEEGARGDTLMTSQLVLDMVEQLRWTTSDGAGRFSVHVHPKLHHVAVRHPDLAAKIVRGHHPQRGPLDIVMESAVTLRGRIVRTNGEGMAGFEVVLTRPLATRRDAVRAQSDGRFAFEGLDPGTYEVTATHRELGLEVKQAVDVPGPDVQMVLPASGTVRGRVRDAATQEPLGRFNVVLSWDLGAGAAGQRALTGGDPSGAFIAADVPAREVTVRVSADGYGESVLEGLSVPADEETSELEFALQPEAVVRGRVTSETGKPVPGASVFASSVDGGSSSATSSEMGDYELRGLPAGGLDLSFDAPGFISVSRQVDSTETVRVDVVLKRSLSLHGDVVSGGKPVQFAMVEALSADPPFHRRAGTANGRFTLEGLVPGRYQVTASAPGFKPAKVENVDAAQASPLRLALERQPTAVLSGRVIGLPMSDDTVFASVTAVGAEGSSSTAAIDASHAFRMEDAPAGQVTVTATVKRGTGDIRNSRPVSLNLAPGSESDTVLEFGNDLTVRGLVVREGAPVPGLTVSFRGPQGSGASGGTDDRGAYEVNGLQPGPQQVSVFGEGVMYATEHLVTGSAELDIDITGATLAGRIARAGGGAPLAGVEVSLFSPGQPQQARSMVTTDNQGRFAMRSLPPGRYRLVASKPGFAQKAVELDLVLGPAQELLLELTPAEGVSPATG